MPEYNWNPGKDQWLRRNRGLSLDDVVYHITHGGLLGDIEHPNQQLHPGQRLYLVPFFRDGDVESLRTFYPSRKYTRDYLE